MDGRPVSTLAPTLTLTPSKKQENAENSNPQVLKHTPASGKRGGVLKKGTPGSSSKNGSSKKVYRPRRSLAAGEARRDRFADHRGAYRAPAQRDLKPMVGRNTGITLKSDAKKDANGFDDASEIWRDTDGEEEEESPQEKSFALPFDISSIMSPTQKEANPFEVIAFGGDNNDDDDDDDDDGGAPADDMDQSLPEVDFGASSFEYHENADIKDKEDGQVEATPAPAAAEEKKRVKTPVQRRQKPKKAGQTRRRQTLKMIDAAQSAGVLAAASHAGGQRRSSRARFQPLEWWRNQRMNFRRTDAGIGTILPVLDEEKPIATPVRDDEQKRPQRRPKDANDIKKKIKVGDASDNEADDEKRAPLDPVAWVVDQETQERFKKALAQSSINLKMQPLPQMEDDEPVPAERLPLACKSFDESKWSTGMLQLPPNGKKAAEEAGLTEVFYVASCPTNALRVRINDSKYNFSKGDTFFVPAGNQYSLRNKSTTGSVKLVFTLIGGNQPIQQDALDTSDVEESEEEEEEPIKKTKRKRKTQKSVSNEEHDMETPDKAKKKSKKRSKAVRA